MAAKLRRVRLQYAGDRYYVVAYLWPDRKSFERALRRRGVDQPKSRGGIEQITMAVHHPAPRRYRMAGRRWKAVPARKLGELHFLRGSWNMEIVVHELTHAAFHRFRSLVCTPRKRGASMEDEESVCYPVGAWADQLYRWLWKVNPNRRWRRV